MSKRIRGEFTETDFKEYEPEDAGQKIGWTTVIPNPDHPSAYVIGAYATVGEQGAAIATVENPTTGERLWHDGLARGLSRACAYAIIVSPGEDTRFRNTDYVRYDYKNAKDLAGHSHHFDFNIDDETVIWGQGDEELTAAIKESLSRHGLAGEYPGAYLSINGFSGQQRIREEGLLTRPSIADSQLFDPHMEVVASQEYARAAAYASALEQRIAGTVDALELIDHQALSEIDILRLRHDAHMAKRQMEATVEDMLVPKLVYGGPENILRELSSGQTIADAYKHDLGRVRFGGIRSLTDDLEHEHMTLDRRYLFARAGAAALFSLTPAGRHQ